jgi:hypothetical protein
MPECPLALVAGGAGVGGFSLSSLIAYTFIYIFSQQAEVHVIGPTNIVVDGSHRRRAVDSWFSLGVQHTAGGGKHRKGLPAASHLRGLDLDAGRHAVSQVDVGSAASRTASTSSICQRGPGQRIERLGSPDGGQPTGRGPGSDRPTVDGCVRAGVEKQRLRGISNDTKLRHYLQMGTYFITGIASKDEARREIVSYQAAWHNFVDGISSV